MAEATIVAFRHNLRHGRKAVPRTSEKEARRSEACISCGDRFRQPASKPRPRKRAPCTRGPTTTRQPKSRLRARPDRLRRHRRHRPGLRGLGFRRPDQPRYRVRQSALTWVEHNTGWLFVLLASGFVVYVMWLAAGRYGRIPLGADDEEPEFKTVSWVAMMFSAGMGIGLMFYGVSEPLSHFMKPPPGTVEGGTDAGPADRDGDHVVPLDPAPVGDLRRGRHSDCLRHLPARPLAADQLGVRAAARQAHRGTDRQGDRQPGDLRDAVRLGRLARPRRAPDRFRRPDPRLDGQDRQRGPGRHHRRPDRRLRRVGGVRCCQGHPMAVEHQHGAGRRPGRLRVRRRPDRADPQPGADRDRRLPPRPGRHGGPDRGQRRRRDGDLAVRLDRLLLGLVDLVDAVRRHVHRPDQPRPDDPAVRHRRPAGSVAGQPGLVLHLRWRGDRQPAQRRGHRRAVDAGGSAVRVAGPASRWRRSPRSWSSYWSRSSSCPVPTRRRS